jgi:type IV pilus assembly protein PilQ
MSPSTIVIDLNKVKTTEYPKIFQEDSSLIDGIKIKRIGEDKFRLLVGLKEKVPYRVYPDQGSTVIELNHIKESLEEGYILSPETQAALTKKSRGEIFLKSINILEKKDRIDIAAKLSGKAVAQVFALDNPLRLVVDLFDTFYSKSTAVYPVKKMGVEKVRTGQFQVSDPYTITRIVFHLAEPKHYTMNSDKDELTISFFKTEEIEHAPPISPPALEIAKPDHVTEEVAPTLPKKEEEKALEQPLSKKTEVPEKPPQSSISSSPKDMEEKKEEPKKLEATPVESVLPNSTEPNKKLPVQEKKKPEQFEPQTLMETEEKYSGEIIGQLRFKDADLRDVVLFLGDFAGLNVVFDPEVSGIVTCDLREVPWDQALDVILKINKMGKVIEGNVLRIAPIKALTKEKEEIRRLNESKEMAQPIIVKTFQLSYSKAADIQDLLKTKLSNRGEIIIDERTNTLVISDVDEKIKILEKLIFLFDTPTPQVSIEARIIEATSTFIRNLGIQWGFRGISDPFYGNQTSIQFPNKALIDGALIPQGIVTRGIGGPLGGYAVNLPAPAFTSAVGVSLANVLDTFRLDLALSALETSGQGKIISSPTITAQNNQEAEIVQGRMIPVQTVANFTVTTRYQNAALQLKATPQITAEGTIIMTIELRNDAPDFSNLVNGIPPIITQNAKTTVMVADGGTTVIGGIYRTEDSITREKVPFLHKIPILGKLFRSFARTKQNRELLIFLTPRIVK